MKTKLTVILLAGGRSQRFWPLEEKNLFPFFGTPLLIYQIKRYGLYLRRKSVEPNFIVVTNEQNYNEIVNLISKTALKKVKVVVQQLPDQSGAIIAALTSCDLSQPLLIANSNDIIKETIISDLLRKVDGKKLILTATLVKDYFPGGYLVLSPQGQLVKIWEKPPADSVPKKLKLFRFVLDYFPEAKELHQLFQENQSSDISYEDALNLLIKKIPSDYVISSFPFTSLKYPWHVLDAMNIFLDSLKQTIVKTNNIDSSAQIEGKVFIEPGVKIGSYVKIVGPCYIGKNTVVADYSLIRHSHIGSSSLVGSYSEIARSYLGNEVMLHRNYIGDSVIGNQTSLGAGTITANWRFDQLMVKSIVQGKKIETQREKLGAILGQQVKVGVGVCLMPGVKVIKQAIIKPNETVYRDILTHEKK